MSGSDDGELEDLSQQLQVVEAQLEAVQEEVQVLRERQNEIDDAIAAIETLRTGSTVQVPIGGGAYVRAAIEDIDEVIVGIGGGYATEQSETEAVDVLEDRQSRIDDRLDELTSVMAELQQQSEELGQRAREHLQQRQQQQLQQRGGLDALGADES